MIGERRNASELIQSYVGGQRNFRNANLSGLELKRAHLPEIDLQGAYLRWVDFQGANLKLANLPWADLQKANLSNATLQKAMLKEANLRKANLQWADLQEAQLQGANLFQSHLICANCRGASLRLANLEAADLDKAELPGADLRVANLMEAQLRNADLKKGKLQGANLSKANLTGANLEGVNLQGSDMREAKLFGANLQGANLQQANLEGADLTEAKLFGANLYKANLQKTILPSLENMQGACLKEAQCLGSVLPKGQILEKAILGNGLISEVPNAAKSLPQGTKNKSQDLLSFTLEREEHTNTKLSEAVTDLVLDQPVDLFSEDKESILNLCLGLNPSRSSLEPEQIAEESDIQIPKTIDMELPLAIVENDSNPTDIDRRDRHLTPSAPRVNVELEEFLEPIKKRMEADRNFTSVSLAIAKRRGPSKLRKELLKAYQGSCSMTGCDVEPILEVAFLQANRPDRKSDPSNGLLLRADLHTLFDLHLIAIDPENLKIMVAPSLRNSSYGELHGQLLRQTSSEVFRPNQESLQLRLQWCSWLNASV